MDNTMGLWGSHPPKHHLDLYGRVQYNVEAGSGLRVLGSSISSMSRMVSANTIKAKSVGMG